MPFLCLGIETSCDETAAAVVADGREVRSDVVRSQVDLHRAFGGVVPELACRAHLETVMPVIDEALRRAGAVLSDLDAIAVTTSPGLVGALLVGSTAAQGLALAAGKPLVAVDHLQAHLYAPALAFPDFAWPCVSLVVSGGHTAVYASRDPLTHESLGSTRDDAAGEAFDKVAQMLGLGFPGGPALERAARDGNPRAFTFPRTTFDDGSLDFSFSGLKTAVLYRIHGQELFRRKVPSSKFQVPSDGRPRRPLGTWNLKPGTPIDDLAASFQEAIVDVLVARSLEACRRTGVRTLAVGGGVAGNGRLREALSAAAGAAGIDVRFPPREWCTDNAAMVAGIAYHLHQAGRTVQGALDVVPTS